LYSYIVLLAGVVVVTVDLRVRGNTAERVGAEGGEGYLKKAVRKKRAAPDPLK
jgi:hypothetical protein